MLEEPEYKNKFDGIIFLTDGYAILPDNPPRLKMLWVLTKDHSDPPFGGKAYINY